MLQAALATSPGPLVVIATARFGARWAVRAGHVTVLLVGRLALVRLSAGLRGRSQ